MIGRGTAAPGRDDETNRLRFEAANRTVHCYTAGRNGAWEAICLEFDIAVQGNAFEEVFSSLQHAISLYIEGVANLPPRGTRGSASSSRAVVGPTQIPHPCIALPVLGQ
jgi:predicted RNase H-like HicB family nuclease